MPKKDKITKDEENALREFLQDEKCLDALSKWVKDPNVFEILGITRTEIRHSKMLAWLLDPSGNHGFGNKVLKGFINYWADQGCCGFEGYEKSNTTDLGFYLKDFADAIVITEMPITDKGRIDLIVVSEEDKFVLTIENKTDSGEHDDQLSRYREYVDKTYDDYGKAYLYLTPNEEDSSNPDEWQWMGYGSVLDIIEDAKERTGLSVKNEVIVNDYIDCLRRYIVGDSELTKISDRIYKKHRQALDLIFEFKTDELSQVGEIIKSKITEMGENDETPLVKGFRIAADADIKQAKSYIRCRSEYMDEIFPDVESPTTEDWKTASPYAYEIFLDGKKREFFIKLTFYVPNVTKEIEYEKKVEQIECCFGQDKKNNSNSRKWRMVFKTDMSCSFGEEITEELIGLNLSKLLQEVNEFESKIRSNCEF